MKNILNLTIIIVAMILFYRIEFVVCQNINEKGVKLFFREDWKEIPAEMPVTQKHVNNPELILGCYGPSADKIRKSHHDKPADDPYYIWSGECVGNWALTLNKKNSLVDLSSGASIKWRSRQAGDRILRIVLGLENNVWLVSEQGCGATPDWHIFTISLDTLKWRNLDINKVVAGELVSNVNLKRVKYVGFTDLMPGGGSPVCSRLDWIEVYGKEISKISK
jgi:hypothetical protein